jgi:hypothetical protein
LTYLGSGGNLVMSCPAGIGRERLTRCTGERHAQSA